MDQQGSRLLDITLLFTLSTAFLVECFGGPRTLPSAPIFFFFSVLLLVYFFLTFIPEYFEIGDKKKQFLVKMKLLVFLMLVGLTVVPVFLTFRVPAYQESLSYVHDAPIQVEEAIKYLTKLKNPYKESYFGTPLESFPYHSGVNPALYHFLYLPFYVLFSWVIRTLSLILFGVFDQRVIHLVSWFGTLFLILIVPKANGRKFLALSLFVFNPLLVYFFISGRNDIFVYFWIFLTFNFW